MFILINIIKLYFRNYIVYLQICIIINCFLRFDAEDSLLKFVQVFRDMKHLVGQTQSCVNNVDHTMMERGNPK